MSVFNSQIHGEAKNFLGVGGEGSVMSFFLEYFIFPKYASVDCMYFLKYPLTVM